RRRAVCVIVDRQPRILVERLSDVAVLRRRESHARREREFRLSEMNEHAPRAPLAGRVAALPPVGGPVRGERADLLRCVCERLERIARTESRRVWIWMHPKSIAELTARRAAVLVVQACWRC